MSQHDDSSFFRTFAVVLGALVVFTLFIAVMANLYSPGADRATDPLVQRETTRQIAPVGQSRVQALAVTATGTAAPAPEPAPEPGVEDTQPVTAQADTAATNDAVAVADSEAVDQDENAGSASMAAVSLAEIPVRVKAVVATNCAGCHRDGLNGAQRSDDAEAWRALEAQGLESLTAGVINGKGAMLPRAETTLTDEEITLAIRYMIAEAVGEDATAVSTDDADGQMAVQSDADTAQAEAAQTDDAAGQTAASPEVADESANGATDTTAITVTAAEIPANVKSVVDGLCATCHISGMANAPKYGDKAAWDSRLAMGMDKLLASAIAGKGVMPPRGGSALSDAELRLAIEYMVTK